MIADLTKVNSEIDFDMFLDAITSKLGDKETSDGIRKIFDLFDDDQSETINFENLKRVARELGETMTAEELEEMLKRAASDRSEISFDDLFNIMTKKTF